MTFRYFDAGGNELTSEQLRAMQIATPAMEHIFATVLERAGKSWKQAGELEEPPPE